MFIFCIVDSFDHCSLIIKVPYNVCLIPICFKGDVGEEQLLLANIFRIGGAAVRTRVGSVPVSL